MKLIGPSRGTRYSSLTWSINLHFCSRFLVFPLVAVFKFFFLSQAREHKKFLLPGRHQMGSHKKRRKRLTSWGHVGLERPLFMQRLQPKLQLYVWSEPVGDFIFCSNLTINILSWNRRFWRKWDNSGFYWNSAGCCLVNSPEKWEKFPSVVLPRRFVNLKLIG